MSYWYYDKEAFKTTPSIQDGIDYATEYKYRKAGARFIVELGSVLELGYNTWATGVVFFHRFYMFQSFKDFPHYVTACSCLFLAGKVEETPKKCRDIIKVAQTLLSEEHFKTFGEDPKEKVMTIEKILLQTIKFDFKLQHPYSFLTKYAKTLKGDKTKLQKMVQMAWTFINDSLCTTLSVQWEPEIIAIALMYLATKLSKFQVINWKGRMPGQTRWWEMFVEDLEMNVIEDICHQVLDLYSNKKEEDKPKEQDPQQVSLKPLSCQKLNDQEPVVSSIHTATSVHPQNSTASCAQIALVHPQKPEVSSPQIGMIPAVKKEIVNADPRTIKPDPNIVKSEPIYINNESIFNKTEPFYTERKPDAIDFESLHIKKEPLYAESKPYSIDAELLHTRNEPPAEMTEPLDIKTKPSIMDTSLVNVEIPLYNPEITKPSSGTPMSMSSTVVSVGNSQPYSPSFLLPDFSMPPPAFTLPTAARAAISVNNRTINNYINPWKTDAQSNNETNGYRETVSYPDIYNNNNNNSCPKDNIQNFIKDDFHLMRFRNPDNVFQRRSYWDDENLDNSNKYFKNESSNFANHFRSRRYSDYSNDRNNRRNSPYSRNFNEKLWDRDACTNYFKKDFQRNARSSTKKRSFYRSSRN